MPRSLTDLMPAVLRPYAKTVVALLGALLSVLQVSFGSDPRVAAVIAVATMLGVYHSPNVPADVAEGDAPATDPAAK